MKIQLDHKSLAKLMTESPEEFILELRNGVLATAIRKNIALPLPEDFKKMCQEELSKCAGELIAIKKHTYGNSYSLKPGIKKEISKLIDSNISGEILDEYKKPVWEEVTRTFTSTKKKLMKHIDTKVEELKYSVDLYIQKSVNQNLAEYINKAVNERLEQIMRNPN